MQTKKPLPAVLIGGPSHVGKSVLAYNLTLALRRRAIEHYVMPANTDGEGHWSQEAPQELAGAIRHKTAWTDTFTQRTCVDIDHRQVPFLANAGGEPRDVREPIFQYCTHAILLLRPEEPEREHFWFQIVEQNKLSLLAVFRSQLTDTPTLEATEPILRGTLVGLERGTIIQGQPFEALVNLLISLFVPYQQDTVQAHLVEAPTSQVIYLHDYLEKFAPGALHWEPWMLPRLLNEREIATHTPCSAYGIAPHWIYSALALHTSPAPFYPFYIRRGWVELPPVDSGSTPHPEVTFRTEPCEAFTLLHVDLATENLDYDQMRGLNIPSLPTDKGLILSGKLPYWLAGAIVRRYHAMHLPWIAGYYPRLEGAVVIFSRISNYTPGDLIPIKPTQK